MCIKQRKVVEEEAKKLNISFVMAHLVAFKALYKAFMFLITAKKEIRIVANLPLISLTFIMSLTLSISLTPTLSKNFHSSIFSLLFSLVQQTNRLAVA